MSAPTRDAYAEAGVDIAAGDHAVELLRDRMGRTSDLLAGSSGFAAALRLPLASRPGVESLLVAATDGVGTKTEIARRMGRLDTIGQDLVAMCADDVVCHGARPFAFLDYLAVGKVDPERVATIVAGVARACAAIDCELVGGETAEHPGLMEVDAFDLAGFCLGMVDRDRLMDGTAAQEGDVVVGLASSGLHANGYSLVRALLADGRLDLDAALGEEGSLGNALLTPTTLYTAHILALLDASRDAGFRIGGLAHITGGGLPGNIPRAVGPYLGVSLTPSAWPVPPVVEVVAARAGLSGPELRATFNAGIGMAVMVEPEAADTALALLEARDIEAWRIGRVVPASVTGPSRYVEVT
ncbi:MAG: phosphoribosylformylglycinamidine cyclo-ligase [Chloroflexota bacterium]|nr:phosphoribosylformylglycinamidine cyclo-ligase [Chloroflexota bacterium]